MSTLHTVNKSPFATGSLRSCLAHARSGDAVLMIEDGVYGATAGTGLSDEIAAAARGGGIGIYVLGPDMAARGLDAGRVLDGVITVDYAGFVDLAAKHDRAVAWL